MPASNSDIAFCLTKLADVLEVEGENPFRIHAYRHAAQLIRHMDQPVANLIAAGKPLTDLPGIGKAIDAKIREIVKTGHLLALEREEAHVPASLRNLLAVPGLGPRRVHILYERLNVQSMGDLESAVESGRFRSLAGFGEKLEAAVRDYLRAHPSETSESALLEPLLSALHHS